MPATICLLCRAPIHLTLDELKDHKVPSVGEECREWLAKGLGLEGTQGLAFSLEQMILVYCVEAAVEAGYIDGDARDEADRMLATVLTDLYTKYTAKKATLPTTAPTTDPNGTAPLVP